jgi:D-alanyl-D-alanine carboxypeptidase
MRTTTPTFALAGLAVTLAACGSGDASADRSAATTGPQAAATSTVATVDEAELQVVLDQWRESVTAYGATLSIRAPGHDVVHLASGIDDRDPETPMPIDGTFGGASITKTFVAAVALQLVAEGRLDLDDTVEAWLPELPAAGDTTLAMLLDHTAGLRNWDVDVLADLTRIYTGEEVLAGSVAQPPHAPPGERFLYTNANFTAAAVLIERELGKGLDEIVAERITGPLTLSNTHIGDGSVRPTRHGWLSLDTNPDPNRPLDNLDFPHEAVVSSGWGAGNLLTSSDDLLAWGDALYSGDLLGDELTAELTTMRRPFAPTSSNGWLVETDEPTTLHYGLGTVGFCLDLTGCSPDDVQVVGHGGSVPGSRSLLAHHRESGTTIVVHANVSDIDLPDLAAILPDVLATLGLS